MKGKWKFELYCKVEDVEDNILSYLIWERKGHYSYRDYKYNRMIELVRAFDGWLLGLSEDFKKEEIINRIENGKFNVHYKWNNDYKKDEWVNIEDVKELYYEIYDINFLGIKKHFTTVSIYIMKKEVTNE